MSIESVPEVPKTEIDGVVDALCSEYDCHIKKLAGHLQDGKTWMFKPCLPSGEIDINEFADELSDRLNFQNETHYVQVEHAIDQTDKPYIRVEPIEDNT